MKVGDLVQYIGTDHSKVGYIIMRRNAGNGFYNITVRWSSGEVYEYIPFDQRYLKVINEKI